MRLIRFGPPGAEKPGLLKGDRVVDLRDVFPEIPDIGESFFTDGWIEKVASVSASGEKQNARLVCPVCRPVLC